MRWWMLGALALGGCEILGEVGATGPEGAAGAEGPVGPQGEPGPPGADGNANILSSGWIEVDGYDWSFAPTRGVEVVYTYQIDAPEITQDVVDFGVVMVFANLDGYGFNDTVWGDNQTGQLPISIHYDNGSGMMIDAWSARVEVGTVELRFVNNLNFWTYGLANHRFRYVVIPAPPVD